MLPNTMVDNTLEWACVPLPGFGGSPAIKTNLHQPMRSPGRHYHRQLQNWSQAPKKTWVIVNWHQHYYLKNLQDSPLCKMQTHPDDLLQNSLPVPKLSHIDWHESEVSLTVLLTLICDFDTKFGSLLHNCGTTLRQLLDNFETTCGQLWDNFGKNLRQLWDNFETTFGQLWDNFGTTLGQLWDNLGISLRQLLGNFERTFGQLWDNLGTI